MMMSDYWANLAPIKKLSLGVLPGHRHNDEKA
jgi:hypothetical protein